VLSVVDFQQPFYDLKQQGTAANPKVVPLIVIAWEPKGKGEPRLSVPQLQNLFFGPANSVAQWFQENSLGRFRLVPHPNNPIIGPLLSVEDWPFYWRSDPKYVRELLCGGSNVFCDAWQQNPFQVPPPPGHPNRYVAPDGRIHYLDRAGYISGHTHSWAEAIRAAAGQIDFRVFDRDGSGNLSTDECLVVIVKAQAITRGFRRSVTGSDVPETDLVVDGVSIKDICELYASPPHGSNDLAVATEEVLHLAANLADQYPDGNYRLDNDPGRPGQLALTDAGHLPVHVDPYHKLKWGWLNPQLADRSGRYTLRDVATTGDALILYSPYLGTDEFFILENRWRGNSYDRFRGNNMHEGLALWHCIQDLQLSNDWARRAIHLRRADPRLDANGQIRWELTLFDGNDPDRGYDLHDDSHPQNLRFRDGMPSRIRIRNISPAGSTMTVDVEVPPHQGEIVATKGRIRMLRAHERGTGFGSPAHRFEEDCIVILDSEPGAAFGIDFTGANASAGRRMFDLLRVAFQKQSTVSLDYEATSAIGGRLIRVIKTG
jgi:M6 family metalloprotease-like protein